MFLHHGIVEMVLHHGSIKDCADPLLDIKHCNRFLCHGSVEKFLNSGRVERVLHYGSMDNCADLLLVIRHHNRFTYAMELWRSSYIVVVWKGSYTFEAWKVVLIRCSVSSTIMIPTPW